MTCQIANVISAILVGMAGDTQGAGPALGVEAPADAQIEVRRTAAKSRLRRVTVGEGRHVELDGRQAPSRRAP